MATTTQVRHKISVEHKESAQAQQAWADYLALGDDRSLQGLIDYYQGRSGRVPSRQLTTLKNWSRWHGWQLRLERMANEAAALAERRQIEVWTDRRTKLRETEHELAGLIANKLRDMLRFPVQRVREERQGENGQTIVTIIEPARWDFGTVGRLLQHFSEVGRIATDQPTTMNAAVGKVTIREIIAEIPSEVAQQYQAAVADEEGEADAPTILNPPQE